MSFVIKCGKCGNEQSFEQNDKARNTNIDITTIESGTWQPYTMGLSIFCENINCDNCIDLYYD